MTEPICKTDKFGNKYWCINGFYHREDGPAVEWVDGVKEWWLNGGFIRSINNTEPENWDELVKLEQIRSVMTE